MKKRDKSRQIKRKRREARLRRQRHEERASTSRSVADGGDRDGDQASSRSLEVGVERALGRPLVQFASERSMRRLQREMAGREFGSRDELDGFVQGLVESQAAEQDGSLIAVTDDDQSAEATAAGGGRRGRPVGGADEPSASMAIERGQDLAYSAMEARERGDDDVAFELALMAIEEDGQCVDARVVLAFLSARSQEQLLNCLLEAVATGEQALGNTFMDQNRGAFWSLVETRPYMRARTTLAEVLWGMGRRRPAVVCEQKTLELNPEDNQGRRYDLLGHLLELGDVAAASELISRYADEASAIFAWGRVLERCLTGDADGARAACAAAHDVNGHCFGYLTGARKLPRELPDYYSFGDESEAMVCATTLRPVLEAHPQLESWLIKHAASLPGGLRPARSSRSRAPARRPGETIYDERVSATRVRARGGIPGAAVGTRSGQQRGADDVPPPGNAHDAAHADAAHADVAHAHAAHSAETRCATCGAERTGRCPTDAEWARLFAAAVAFRDLAPWDWMADSEVVSLVDPESGETHHASVLGARGEMYALVLYLGPQGLECHRRTQERELSEQEALFVQPCLMASFEDREALSASERRLIKALGLRFRGRGAWPQFTAFEPGLQPWGFTGRQACLLTHALEQASAVACRVADGALELPSDESLFVCVPRVVGEGLRWEHEVRPMPPRELLAGEQPARLDAVRAARLVSSGSVVDETWQFDALPLNEFIGKRGQRASLARTLLWADAGTGLIRHVHVVLATQATDDAAQQTLELFESQGSWPARIEITRPVALAALQQLADALDIELIPCEALGVIDELVASMQRDLGPG